MPINELKFTILNIIIYIVANYMQVSAEVSLQNELTPYLPADLVAKLGTS